MRNAISIGLLCAATILASTAAEARGDGHRNVGNRGATVNTTNSGTLAGGRHREQNIQFNNGREFNRSADSTYNKDTGEFSRTVSNSGGASRTVTGTKKDGNVNGTYTDSQGHSATFTGTRTQNDDGSVTRSGSVTGADGNTRSRSVTVLKDNDIQDSDIQ